MQKNYGLVIPKAETREEGAEHMLGALGAAVINPSGSWKKNLPIGEKQSLNGIEPSSCVSMTTNSSVETLIKFLGVAEENYSDRALAIASDTNPAVGNDPHKVGECARKTLGFVPEQVLPMNDSVASLAEYYSPKPLSISIINEGKKWFTRFTMNHEWVFVGNTSSKKAKLKTALTKGTVGVSVCAWFKDGGVYIKPEGMQDNHFCQLVEFDAQDRPIIFDSYADGDADPYLKTLSVDYDFYMAKVYYVTKKNNMETQKISLLQKLLDALKKLVGLYEIAIEQKKTEPQPVPQPQPVPHVSRITEWARAIEAHETDNGKNAFLLSLNNPCGLRCSTGWSKQIKCHARNYAVFGTYADGFETGCTMLRNAASGKSQVYKPDMTLYEFFAKYAPDSDNNLVNPNLASSRKYAEVVAAKLKVAPSTKIKELL